MPATETQPAETSPTLTCYFCGATAPSVEAAIDLDWVPSFFDYPEDSSDEILYPCCRECGVKNLIVGEDGELELAKSITSAV